MPGVGPHPAQLAADDNCHYHALNSASLAQALCDVCPLCCVDFKVSREINGGRGAAPNSHRLVGRPLRERKLRYLLCSIFRVARSSGFQWPRKVYEAQREFEPHWVAKFELPQWQVVESLGEVSQRLQFHWLDPSMCIAGRHAATDKFAHAILELS
jgi:hypothetical protein